MAYTSSGLKLSKGGVINEWVYEATDPIDTVLGAAYVTDAVAISNSTPGKGLVTGDRVLFRRFSTVGTPSTFMGAWDLCVGSTSSTTGAATLINMAEGTAPWTVSIAAAAGATNAILYTVTVLDSDGNTLADVYSFEIYMSEAATGIGVTADTYSGDLVASTGSLISSITAKKHWSVTTAATGIFAGSLTDTNTPADQYMVVQNPATGEIVVSVASGTLWGA